MKQNIYGVIFMSCIVLTGCSLPWSPPENKTSGEPDAVERQFSDDLSWVEHYGRPEYLFPPIASNPPSQNIIPGFPRQWRLFRHPTLPIQFAYPANANLIKREIDLDTGDSAIDIEVREPQYSLITLTFQRDMPFPSHIASSQKMEMNFGGVRGIYYNARNFKNGNPSLEKFIANLPNSRYGIHVAGQGPLFQTLLNSIQLY